MKLSEGNWAGFGIVTTFCLSELMKAFELEVKRLQDAKTSPVVLTSANLLIP